VADIPKSPFYSSASGITIVMFVIFGLGFLATGAEPALNVLGKTVQDMSNGEFSSRMLVTSVALGVGIGMSVGSTKILFRISLISITFFAYFIALVLTYFTPEDFSNIAWDSAGVTTGPVTVPFVLALGIGLSKAVNSEDGFGMLTVASAGPIISVLASYHLRKTCTRISS
jgi:hypothetical protein